MFNLSAKICEPTQHIQDVLLYVFSADGVIGG